MGVGYLHVLGDLGTLFLWKAVVDEEDVCSVLLGVGGFVFVVVEDCCGIFDDLFSFDVDLEELGAEMVTEFDFYRIRWGIGGKCFLCFSPFLAT